ncbi:unnamed protein product [Acanthoscelides obtectus]|uniref:BESS domain-containing protein n=1 Tax=Acanthoscelides obtectus TaxID=200917 RepID=A0A9P0LQ40_ACAOB|nr:unnamed protein product [Acanthoscelides obtectus]CAK1680515.1 hypothetical protein AOBTE_LOCUS32717 [Acanthoscelides obtectus]
MVNLVQQTLEQHAIRRRQREEERKRKADENPDGLYQFFLSMYHDSLQMPKASQLIIKRKLFEAVQVEEDLSVSLESEAAQRNASSVEINSPATSRCSAYEHELPAITHEISQQSFHLQRATNPPSQQPFHQLSAPPRSQYSCL